MSQYYKQLQTGGDDARRLLRERLAREEMSDAAYEKSVAQYDNRAFKVFGVVFISAFAAVVGALAYLGW